MFTKMKNWLIRWNFMPILLPVREDGFLVIGAMLAGAAVKAYGKYKNAKSKEEAIAAEAELQNAWAEADEEARTNILSEIGGGDPKVGMSNLMNMKSTTESIRNDQSTSTTRFNELTSPEWAGKNKDMQGNVNILKALDRARLAQSDTSLAGEMTARTIRAQNDAARAAGSGQSLDTRAGGLGLSGGAPGSLNPDIEAARVAAALGTVGNEQQLARQIGFENQDRSMALAEMLKASRRQGTSTTDSSGTSTMNSSTFNPFQNIQAAYMLTSPQPRTTTKTGMAPGWTLAGDLAGAAAQAYASYAGKPPGGGE